MELRLWVLRSAFRNLQWKVRPCGFCQRLLPRAVSVLRFGSAAPPCDPSARYLLEEMPEVLARRGHVDGEAQRLRGVNVFPTVVDKERFGRYHAAVSDHLAENRLRRLQFVQRCFPSTLPSTGAYIAVGAVDAADVIAAVYPQRKLLCLQQNGRDNRRKSAVFRE